MNIQQAKSSYDDRNAIRWAIRESKASDYADPQDIHRNFRQRAALIQTLKPDLTQPAQVALFDAVLKIQRIVNLLNQGKSADNEPIQDSYLDLLNYIDLSLEQVQEECN